RPESLDRFAAKGVYAAVIHLAAMAEAARAEKQPREAYLLTVIGTRNVAHTAARDNLKVFYVTTDYVFEGVKGDYLEEDIPHPANWYGATKYAGELEIGESGCAYAIIRTSFRPAQWGFPTAYTNVYTTADYVDVIAQELVACIELDVGGVLHVGTPMKTFFE